MKNKSHKAVFLQLFIITALFLTVLISVLLYFGAYYFTSYHFNRNRDDFQFKVAEIQNELDGKIVANEEIAVLLGSLFEEYGSNCALFRSPNSKNADIGYVSNHGNGFNLDEIYKYSKSLVAEMFTGNDTKPIFESVKIDDTTYFISVAHVTVNNEDFVLGVASPMQSIDNVTDAINGASWLIYTVTIIVSMGLAAVISMLITRPMIREAEYKLKLERIQKDFIMNASHEMKTPISIISGYAETLMEGFLDDDERKDYERGIYDEANKMSKLTKNLLTIAMLQEDKQVSETTVDLLESIQEATDRFYPLLKKRNIEILTQTSDRLTVKHNETQLAMVLSNLISNAISHTPENGKIVISCNRQDNIVKFEIENEGEPIPAESLDHIWESFYRADKAHGRDEGRFGLGLYIVRTIIEKHGGTVGVENTAKGVKFSFSLPHNF